MKLVLEVYSFKENVDKKIIFNTESEFKIEELSSIRRYRSNEDYRMKEEYLLEYFNNEYLIDEKTYRYLHNLK